MEYSQIKTNLQNKITKAEEALSREFSGLRTGRASVNLLDSVMVEAYGSVVPLNQVGNVTILDARCLAVQVWDKGLLKAVEKGIAEADLGLNPANDGVTIRVPIPPLSEERRLEMCKIAGKYAESSRVAIRSLRREALDEVKALKDAKEISEDDEKKYGTEIQGLVDAGIKRVDEHLKKKEAEIKQV